MPLNQHSQTILNIFQINKEKEISYKSIHNLIVNDKITDLSYSLIKEKYNGVNKLKLIV